MHSGLLMNIAEHWDPLETIADIWDHLETFSTDLIPLKKTFLGMLQLII